MQMRDFLRKMLFPNFFDSGILFVLVTGIIEITFGIFVHDEIFQPRAGRIFERAVSRDMLFLDHGNFIIQFSA